MKSIQITIEIPEKKDIIKNMDHFSNSEIQHFINDFEGMAYKKANGKDSNFKKYWSLTRKTERYDEFYSMLTSTVYQIDKGGYYYKIYFIENRPKNIGYGIDPKTRQGRAYCKICETMIFSTPDLIGRTRNYCGCKEAQIE